MDWVEGNWKKALGYTFGVEMLNRGWFALNFQREEELRWVLNKSWHLDHSPVLLKQWHPLFDASRERVDVIPIWVRMPALPLHFWELYHFKRIGDILGSFLEADFTYLETHERKVARILVNINIREGLAEYINLEWGPIIHPQLLDYENVPFRCRRCHAYGHPVSECSKPAWTPNGGRNAKVKECSAVSKEKGPPSSDSSQAASDDLGSESSNDAPSQVGLVIEEISEALVELHLVLSREDAPRGPPIPGISSFTIPPSVNFFMNFATFLGHDWVEGLRNLYISGLSGPPSFFPLGPSELAPGPSTDSLALTKDPSQVPFLPEDSVFLEPDPGDPLEEGYLSPTESMDSGYFLHSCKKPSSAGLGKSHSPVRKGRGRKSNFHKAQSRAKVDLLEGKQLSIEKALRAGNAKKKGRK